MAHGFADVVHNSDQIHNNSCIRTSYVVKFPNATYILLTMYEKYVRFSFSITVDVCAHDVVDVAAAARQQIFSVGKLLASTEWFSSIFGTGFHWKQLRYTASNACV